MTIQLSVTVWTILCFLALYFILRNLLFKPLLEVMDKRREKIAAAAEARAEAGRKVEELRQQQLAEQEAQRLQARKAADAEAENVRLEGKRLLDEARKARIAAVEQYRATMEAEYAEEMKKVEEPMQALADRFLSHLFASKP